MKARKPLTTIVGACLAAVAAGCLVLFSLLAQSVTLGESDGGAGVKVATPEENSPVISLPGRSGSRRTARIEDGGRATETPFTGPLALLVEPLAPGDTLAELVGPGGGADSTPSSTGPSNSNGGGGDRVAVAPDRLGRGPRTTLDANARAVRAAILALRAEDRGTGRPAPGDGDIGRPGKGKGAGGDKGKGHVKNDKGHAKNGKGHVKSKNHDRKRDKGKSKAAKGNDRTHGSKSKAPKPNHSKGGRHQKASSPAPKAAKPQKGSAASHSSGPPAHSKSKAPKQTPPGHATGGPPGKAKGKKR